MNAIIFLFDSAKYCYCYIVKRNQMLMLISVTTYSFQTGAVYISTEDVFPSKRLHQLTQSFAKGQAFHSAASLTDNIFIEHAADVVSS